jgi:hypothetical protein
MSIGELKPEFDFSSIVTEKVLHCEKLFKVNFYF